MNNSDKSLLIVDDEEYIRQSFADYFGDRSWQVFKAQSGEQALKLLDTKSPATAIVDIRMGGMDGNTFIRKAHSRKPEMSFIICTGSPKYDVPADLIKLTCVSDKLFKKPVTDISALEKELLRSIDGHEG